LALLVASLGGQTIQTVAGGVPRLGETYPALSVSVTAPWAIASDPQGDIYVAEQGRYLDEINAQGQFSRVTSTVFDLITSLALGPDGQIYAVDHQSATLYKIDPHTGTATPIAGKTLVGGPYLSGPWNVAVDASGNLYVSDSPRDSSCTVNEIPVVGSPRMIASCPLISDESLTGLAPAPGGDLWISDPVEGIIWRYSSRTGAMSQVASFPSYRWHCEGVSGPTTVGCPRAAAITPQSLAADAAGNLFFTVDGGVEEVPAGSSTGTLVAGCGSPGCVDSAFTTTGAATAISMVPEAVAMAPSGALLIADTFDNWLRSVDVATGELTTLAGNGLSNDSGDGGPPLAAQLYTAGLATDAAGNVFFTNGAVVRQLTPAGGLSTMAGRSTAKGYTNLGPAPATAFDLMLAARVANDGNGHLYISDDKGWIWKVDLATGTIRAFAGPACNNGVCDTTGAYVHVENLTAWNSPVALAADASGDVYVVAKPYQVIEIAADGSVTVVAGGGSGPDGGPAATASLGPVQALALDHGGNLYLTDGNGVREVNRTTGLIQTVVPPAALGELPVGLGFDPWGDLFIGEFGPHGMVQEWSAAGALTTLAGTGANAAPDYSGPASGALLPALQSLAVDHDGDVYFGTDAHDLREIKTQPRTSLSLASVSFGNANVGEAAIAQQVLVTNSGGVPLSLTAVQMTGAQASDFTLTNGCAAALPVNATCQLTIGFTPGATGARAAAISFTDNSPSGGGSIALSGTGTTPAAVLQPASLDFGTLVADTASAPQSVTLNNRGTGVLNIASIAASAGFSQTNDCGSQVAAGASCTVRVKITPSDVGAKTGTLTLDDDAGGSSQTVSLTGSGEAMALAPSGSDHQTITAGQTAQFALALTPASTLNGAAALTCGVSPADTSVGCAVSPASIQLAGTTIPVTVTLTTKAATSSWLWLLLPFGGGLWLMAAMADPRRFHWTRWALVAGMALALAGCGGGSAGTGSGANSGASNDRASATPAGTYTLKVTATAGTNAQATSLTVVVQ
jgi:hypothetical protein